MRTSSRVEALDVGVQRRLLAGLDDVALELGLGLVVGLLDPGRVDAAVGEELLQRHPGDLAPDAVEAGQDHGVGRVVDDEVDAGEVLEGADVAALAADDAALHVVGGELDDGHRGLGRVAGGEALHDDGEDVADAAVGVALGLLLDLAHEPRRVVADLVLELLEQDLLGLRGRDARSRARARARGARARRASPAAAPPASAARASSSVARVSRASSRAVRRSSRRPISCRRASALSVSAFPAASLALTAARGVADGAAPAAASPGARFTSSNAATTRPTAKTAAAITISIVRVLSPNAALQGAARSDASRFQDAADRIRPGPGARDQHSKAAARPPRQMAAK